MLPKYVLVYAWSVREGYYWVEPIRVRESGLGNQVLVCTGEFTLLKTEDIVFWIPRDYEEAVNGTSQIKPFRWQSVPRPDDMTDDEWEQVKLCGTGK